MSAAGGRPRQALAQATPQSPRSRDQVAALSPQATLDRGYAVAAAQRRHRSYETPVELSVGEHLVGRLAAGRVSSWSQRRLKAGKTTDPAARPPSYEQARES